MSNYGFDGETYYEELEAAEAAYYEKYVTITVQIGHVSKTFTGKDLLPGKNFIFTQGEGSAFLKSHLFENVKDVCEMTLKQAVQYTNKAAHDGVLPRENAQKIIDLAKETHQKLKTRAGAKNKQGKKKGSDFFISKRDCVKWVNFMCHSVLQRNPEKKKITMADLIEETILRVEESKGEGDEYKILAGGLFNCKEKYLSDPRGKLDTESIRNSVNALGVFAEVIDGIFEQWRWTHASVSFQTEVRTLRERANPSINYKSVEKKVFDDGTPTPDSLDSFLYKGAKIEYRLAVLAGVEPQTLNVLLEKHLGEFFEKNYFPIFH